MFLYDRGSGGICGIYNVVKRIFVKLIKGFRFFNFWGDKVFNRKCIVRGKDRWESIISRSKIKGIYNISMREEKVYFINEKDFSVNFKN